MKKSLLHETDKLPAVLKWLLMIISSVSMQVECKENLASISIPHGV